MAREIDPDRLREAARRSGMPFNVTVGDIEDLAAEYARLAPDEDGLDAAWAAAEAALPDGWAINLHPDWTETSWQAEGRIRGVWHMAHGPLPSVMGTGDTPVAALRSLAERLAARPSPEVH